MARSNLFQLTRECGQQIPRWLLRVLPILTLLWLVLSLWQAPVVRLGKRDMQELRGVWMTNFGATLMYYTTRMDEVVAHQAQHHLNTLYPAVWNRGYTLNVISRTSQSIGNSLPQMPASVLSAFTHK